MDSDVEAQSLSSVEESVFERGAQALEQAEYHRDTRCWVEATRDYQRAIEYFKEALVIEQDCYLPIIGALLEQAESGYEDIINRVTVDLSTMQIQFLNESNAFDADMEAAPYRRPALSASPREPQNFRSMRSVCAENRRGGV